MLLLQELLSLIHFSRSDYNKIKEEVWQENKKNLRFFSYIAVFAFGAMAVVSLFSASIERNLALYIVYFLLSLFFLAASHLKAYSIKVCECLVYAFFAVLMSFGIVMGTLVFPEDLTVSYIVLMIALPLMFTVRAVVTNILVCISMIIYVVMARFTQDTLIFNYNLLDVIPYGLISMFITAAIMRGKMQRLLYYTEVESLERTSRESQEKISAYEKFVADMMKYASSEEDPDKVLAQLVQYIGETLGSDRAYIFEENSRGTFDNTYEWCRAGVSSEMYNLQSVPYEGVIEIWYREFKKSSNIVIHDIEEYKNTSLAIYDVLRVQGINTLVAGPIIIEGRMIGFYGVDNPPEEQLNDISDLIGMMEFIVSFMIRLRNNAKKLEYGALHDQLTNCKNRKALEWLYSEKSSAGKPLAVVMCDLNGLKDVNDRQGHDAGDRFIVKTAEILMSVFGSKNVYRIGGDEFVAVLPGIEQKDFEEMTELAGIQLGTTVSVGVAYKAQDDDTAFGALLKTADANMYAQKISYYSAAGNNRRKREING